MHFTAKTLAALGLKGWLKAIKGEKDCFLLHALAEDDASF